jgi:hypothetical protein
MSYKGNQQVQLDAPERSTFDFSHEHRTTTRIGRLTPVFIQETLPNDTWYGNIEVLIKFAPLLFPIFARLYMFVHWHFIPNRILASWWPDFITGGRLGEQVTVPAVPSRFTYASVGARAQNLLDKSSIINYMGHPPLSDAAANALATRTFDVLPLAAFYKVWYDWYRDRNYVPDNTILPLPAGTISTTATIDALMGTKKRGWEADYFTTTQTNTQRGAEVLLPLQGTGTVTYLATSIARTTGGALAAANQLVGTVGASGQFAVEKTATGASGVTGRIENIQSVQLTSSDISINDTRRAFALQKWLERNQLAGSRMDESIMAHFKRRTSDARLQMAEYLGGSKTPCQITELMSSAWSNDGTTDLPQGNLSGNAMVYGTDNRVSYNCEEWGFLIATMSVMPRTSYKQGLPRMFQQRDTFLSYPWPTFAHLGEQEVYNNELFLDATSLPIDRTTQPIFGYTSRYSDWKQATSKDTGDFYDNMEAWTITRKFATQPVLGNTFVEFDDALQDQIFAVAAADTLWCYIYTNMKVKRSLPYYGTPRLVG